VTEIALPDQDGFWLVRQMRDLKPEAGATVPAIALCARRVDRGREEALIRGFEAYLEKPLDPWALCRSVEQVVARG
jgi:DNA-binding response OmpR family regulator